MLNTALNFINMKTSSCKFEGFVTLLIIVSYQTSLAFNFVFNAVRKKKTNSLHSFLYHHNFVA